MHAWSRPGNRADVPDEALAWEPELWRRLIAGQEDQTLLAAYRNMESIIARSGIEDIYPHIFIYMPSALPPPHLHFSVSYTHLDVYKRQPRGRVN